MKLSISNIAWAEENDASVYGLMKKYGFRGAYALYLVMIATSDGSLTAAKLADLCQRDKADISRAVSAFQKKGILEPYGESRYRAALRLTEEGQRLAAKISLRADEVLEQAGKGISEEMRNNMYLFGKPFMPVTAMTERISESEWLPPKKTAAEPYFKTTFFEDVSEAYRMMALSFPALRIY
jgi:DNA-binding MarR family transcriptional regulator